MNRKNTTYQMLTRVVNFGTRNVGLFPTSSAAAELMKALEAGVKTLSEEATIRESAAAAVRIGRKAKMASRNELKNHLTRARKLSRVLRTDNVWLPANPSDQNLIDGGRRLTRDAESLKQEFIEHALPPEFVDELGAAVKRLEDANAEYATAIAMRAAAVERWNKALEPALEALRRFDLLVANALDGNHGALASYAVARAVRRVAGHKAAEDPPLAAAAAAS